MKKPKKSHPQMGQMWEVRMAKGYFNASLTVVVLDVSEPYEKGTREVLCLVTESDSSKFGVGTSVLLTNGAFNPPNTRIL